MKTGNRSNALLVELLIVVMFFMLASTVLLQVFSTAHNQISRAGIRTRALNEAQNVADRLYAARTQEDEGAVLAHLGYSSDESGTQALEKDGYTLTVHFDSQAREAGNMRLYTVEAYQADELLFTLPVARYEEGQP